ncbi:MAG: hypothetical protein KUL78_03230 [Flavobacterium sp.]|nr:hypothetical protein [Flavobacterium sp.]
MNFTQFATVYGVTPNGYCHGCIRYSEHHTKSGVCMVSELKKEAKGMPIFDITNTTRILGLNVTNIEKYGGKRL